MGRAVTRRGDRSGQCRARGLLLSSAVAVAMLPAGAAQAQVIRGRVLDADGGRGIEGAIVRLITTDSQHVDMLLTGSDGEFILVAPRGGTYLLEAEHVAYVIGRTAPFPVPAAGTVTRTVPLVRHSRGSRASLPPLRVQAVDQPREGDELPDVPAAGDPGHGPLHAQAEP